MPKRPYRPRIDGGGADDSKSFINATYLQSHMHRKHQEHTTYIGDAILHTKAITQNVQDKPITVQD